MTLVENFRPFGWIPANGSLPLNVPVHFHWTATVCPSATMLTSFHCTSGKLLRINETTLKYPSAPYNGSDDTGVSNGTSAAISSRPNARSLVLMHFSNRRIFSFRFGASRNPSPPPLVRRCGHNFRNCTEPCTCRYPSDHGKRSRRRVP